MSSRFGDMLLNRRRQLGMSIQQVANVIKIRPQIIEYFETANFAAMPPRGYAQGMISSYARYLGLNPREVVDAYFDELATYERVHNTGAGRFQDSVAEASPHGDNATGRFMMVNAVPASRYAQRPPQAGYISESHSPHEPVPASRLRHDPRSGRPGMGPGRALPSGAYGQGPREPRPDLPPRRRAAGASDLPPRTYRGNRGDERPTRYRGAPPDPRTARRQNASRQAGRGRGAAPSPLASIDPRILIGLIAILLVILLAGSVALFKGCTAQGEQKPAAGSTLADSSKDSSDGDDTDADEGPDAEGSADESGDNGDASTGNDVPDADGQSAQVTETKVQIKIAKGKTSWVEVKLDGKGEFADTVVGPFSKEYTVTQSIEISVTNPADVVITKNGEKVRYDSKSSGVGRVTITVPKVEAVDSDGDGTPDSQDPDAQTADSSNEGQTAASA